MNTDPDVIPDEPFNPDSEPPVESGDIGDSIYLL
jgi:hypothetical protein